MSSLFEGDPQQATSYTTSSTETPKWMQDAIYNQIQWATNVANKPYQPYEMPTVAELSGLQQKAYEGVQQNVGAWQPAYEKAQSGLAGMVGQTAGTTAAQKYADQAGKMLADINYSTAPSSYQSYLNSALQANPMATAGQQLFNRAGSMDVTAAAQPYMQAAGTGANAMVGQYMNPYQQNVMNVMAQQAARNLQENLLPAVSDQFVRAGQFGSSRMGEFGARALRDTQEALLAQQAQSLQQGYGQALGAAQTDLARQAQLAGTAGQLTGQQAQQLASLGQAQTAAGQAQQQAMLTGGQNYANLMAQSAAQQQAGAGQYAGLGSAMAGIAGSDAARQASTLQNLANLAQQRQSMGYTDTAALEAAGRGQQAQTQAQLDAARSQYEAARLYPQQQLDWLSTQVRGMAPITPSITSAYKTSTGDQYSASPLSQLATGLATYKGLQNLG